MCFFLSPIRNDPKNKRKNINKILAPTQSRDNPANVLIFMWFSFPEKNTKGISLHSTVAGRV